MWPFKKRDKPMTVEEYAAPWPPAPCGNQKEHIFWEELNDTRCPVCAGIERRKRKEEDENRMAEKIAAAVVRKIQTPSNAELTGHCTGEFKNE